MVGVLSRVEVSFQEDARAEVAKKAIERAEFANIEAVSLNDVYTISSDFSQKELENKNLSDIIEDPQEGEKLYKRLEKEGRVTNQEIEIACKNREKKTTLASFFYIRDDEGRILAMGSIFKDITRRKKDEKMLA